MEQLIEKREKTISEFNPSNIEVELINKYEKASDEFEQLVADGLVKKRDYTLSTIDQEKELIVFNR